MLYLAAASLDASALAEKRDHVVAGVDQPLDVDAEALEVLGPLGRNPDESVVALLEAILGPVRRSKPLEARVEVLERALSPGTVEGRPGCAE
jgi:hypothetical protein